MQKSIYLSFSLSLFTSSLEHYSIPASGWDNKAKSCCYTRSYLANCCFGSNMYCRCCCCSCCCCRFCYCANDLLLEKGSSPAYTSLSHKNNLWNIHKKKKYSLTLLSQPRVKIDSTVFKSLARGVRFCQIGWNPRKKTYSQIKLFFHFGLSPGIHPSYAANSQNSGILIGKGGKCPFFHAQSNIAV